MTDPEPQPIDPEVWAELALPILEPDFDLDD